MSEVDDKNVASLNRTTFISKETNLTIARLSKRSLRWAQPHTSTTRFSTRERGGCDENTTSGTRDAVVADHSGQVPDPCCRTCDSVECQVPEYNGRLRCARSCGGEAFDKRIGIERSCFTSIGDQSCHRWASEEMATVARTMPKSRLASRELIQLFDTIHLSLFYGLSHNSMKLPFRFYPVPISGRE
jgi:hypothetical protein